MCGACDCGLHDCPGHPPPEPEQCKDPANGGPDGGDCGWTNRCRGSLEGCKLGCKIQQSAGRTSWGFVLVLALSSAAYVGGGVGFAVKRLGAPPALSSHPHYRQWQEVGGLVADGAQLTQAKLTGRPMPKQSRGGSGGGAGAGSYSPLSDAESGGGGSPSSKDKKKKKEKKEKKESKKGRGDRVSDGSPRSDTGAADAPVAAAAAPASAGGGGDAGVKATASGGGGRWVHVPT
eukprot:COSAG06_NODE_6253_length_3012_cov_3.331617_4_plen_233_part_00